MVYTITVHLRANSDPSSVEKLKAKLIEASRVYSQDKETISWFVMQSTSDPRDFTIVERYEQESVSWSRIKRHDFFARNKARNLGGKDELVLSTRILTPSTQSQKYHLENPYWKTFDPYVIPLLEKPMDLRRFEELDTSKDVVVPA